MFVCIDKEKTCLTRSFLLYNKWTHKKKSYLCTCTTTTTMSGMEYGRKYIQSIIIFQYKIYIMFRKLKLILGFMI